MVQVAVVGSANIDFVAPVEYLPREGETVLGSDYSLHPGGKGANQAVAAALMGTEVAFIGAVGDDQFGDLLCESLSSSGVQLDGLRRLKEIRTGAAFIAVDESGRNQIVVSPGANQMVDHDFIQESADILADAEVLLVQLEIPDSGVLAAVKASGGTVIVNPAPARPLTRELLELVDVLIPNEIELGILAGAAAPTSVAETAALAQSIAGPEIIITTRGAKGAVICTGTEVFQVPSLNVRAVDSTGAGDTFCGAFAAGLAVGLYVEDAAAGAAKAAAISVTRLGAQTSMPTLVDMVDFTG